MDVIKYFLISIFYFWASSTALSIGIGYYTLYRPIIAGMMTGLILGDINTGMLAGAIINIIYIDFVSSGGSLKGDQCLSAIIAAAASIMFKISPLEAAAFAYPFGFIGILIWKYRLKINCIFVNRYIKKYDSGLNPDISVYNGLLPQLLLYFMCLIVIVISFGVMFLFKDILNSINLKMFLFLFGILLINISVINILKKLNNKYSIIFFIIALFGNLIINVNAIYLFYILFIFIIILIINDFKPNEKTITKEKRILSKKHLFYSWFIWMNFSHACYNYERLQGMAFAHSMKSIIKTLYKNENKAAEIIKNQTDFFNTEPNMGTPIHGYIIYLEEQNYLGKEKFDINNIKKGMMGIAAGLGDSFTQVVLTPLFISLSVMLSLDKHYFTAMIPVIFLGAIILYISYSGWMNGYYEGRESLLKRINIIKNSKIKKYFPIIFGGILGFTFSKLIFLNQKEIYNNLAGFMLILIISVIYVLYKNFKLRS